MANKTTAKREVLFVQLEVNFTGEKGKANWISPGFSFTSHRAAEQYASRNYKGFKKMRIYKVRGPATFGIDREHFNRTFASDRG